MTQFNVDLTNCDREPIHILGYIQSHGYLIVLQPETYTVIHASANAAELIGQPVANVLGWPLDRLLAQTDLPVATLTELLPAGRRHNTWEPINPQTLRINGRIWNVIIHEHDGLLLLEWEPADAPTLGSPNQRLITEAIAELQSSRQLIELLQNTARRIKSIIGFDRVMVYRFAADWHGQVVAEEKEAYLEPFLGLHYPASDIPKQARELYKSNLVRLIADVNSTPAPILSVSDWPDTQPVDLTQATLRAVSPVHITYLKNMGVAASMSISLLYRGELWGLISCHHSAPRFVDYNARQEAKLVGQLLSAALEFRTDEEDQADVRTNLENGKRLHEQLLTDNDIAKALTRHPVTALSLTKATGAILLFNNKQYRLGKTPDEAAIQGLTNWLKTTTDPLIVTSQLSALYPNAEAFRATGAGMLAVVLSREMNEYLLWFKPELIQQVTWAGNPDKPVTISDDGQARISPRQSFAAWTEQVRNRSEPWTPTEITAVSKLREDILQVVTRQANEIRLLNQQLQEAYEELDAFSYTVSHDLRTPLSSIRCYTEILLDEHASEFSAETQAVFQKIVDSTERMRLLIRHILHYSRMGRTEITTQAIDMEELLKTIREELLLGEKDRVLTLTINSAPPLHADPVMIQQLFTNLLSNAVKYTRLAPEGYVEVSGQQTGEEVIYSVTDNGVGFDMRGADKIFDLFKRLENARSFEGSGVGLAIVKRIVSRNGGKIRYHSEPNRGTTFFVSFPVNPVTQP